MNKNMINKGRSLALVSLMGLFALLLVVCALQKSVITVSAQEQQVVTELPLPPSPEELERQEAHAQVYNQNARANFNLPKMFDFELYKRSFGKVYSSALEEMVRLKLFLARQYRAFVTAVAYKYRTSSYYLRQNQRSDWTPEELAASENKYLDSGNATRSSDDDDDEEDDDAFELVDPAQLEEELALIEERSSEPGYAELAEELRKMRDSGLLDAGKKRRVRRDLASAGDVTSGPRDVQTRDFDISQALGRASAEDSNAASAYVKSNNPDYQPPELMSMGAYRNYLMRPDFQVPRGFRADLGPSHYYGHLPVKGNYKKVSLAESLWALFGFKPDKGLNVSPGGRRSSGTPNTPDSGAQSRISEALARRSSYQGSDDNGDVVWVDHRLSGCLPAVADQGSCGSCYVFATTAFFEYAYCKETRKSVKFAEQYALDCGSKMGHHGCEGGYIDRMAEFFGNFGVELAQHYPYKAHKELCPYDPSVDMTHMGYIKLNVGYMAQVPVNRIENYLKHTPMVVNINTEGDFQEYGGGVWDGRDCQERGKHSMLLIGHGREDGEEYWLFRNSYSGDWGEAGHIKINKNSDCIHPRHGFVWGARDGANVRLSPERNAHVPRPVVKDRAYNMKNFLNNAKGTVTFIKKIGGKKSDEVDDDDD